MYWSCYRGEGTESREYYVLFTLSQKPEKRKEKQKVEEGFCFYDRLLFFFFFFYLPSTEDMGSPRCAGIKKSPLALLLLATAAVTDISLQPPKNIQTKTERERE